MLADAESFGVVLNGNAYGKGGVGLTFFSINDYNDGFKQFHGKCHFMGNVILWEQTIILSHSSLQVV